jgi:hypothetical protein
MDHAGLGVYKKKEKEKISIDQMITGEIVAKS